MRRILATDELHHQAEQALTAVPEQYALLIAELIYQLAFQVEISLLLNRREKQADLRASWS